MHTAHIIAVGNEVLIGRTLDTNSHYLAKGLHALGIRVIRFSVIPDEESAILETLRSSPAEILITTGGLGATADDITRQTLARYFGYELVVHAPTLDRLHEYYAKRGRQINNVSAKMAVIPSGAMPLDNEVGAAPGLYFSMENGRSLFCLPGVPFEVQHLFTEKITPILKRNYTGGVVLQHIYRTAGIPESQMAILIEDIENEMPDYLSLAYNPGIATLDMRLVLQSDRETISERQPVFESIVKRLGERISDYCYGTGEDTLESGLGVLLLQKKRTLATAESCTGGGLMARMVSVPGSSRYISGGVIAYSNEIKIQHLGVDPETIKQYGAVSETCACEMAAGIRQKIGSDVAISVTGIAGPDGGSDEKPVGTVWIGYSDVNKCFAQCFRFEKDRQRNIERSIISAMNLLRLELLKK